MTNLDPAAIMAEHADHVAHPDGSCVVAGGTDWPRCLRWLLAKDLAEARTRAQHAERARDENLELAQREARERVVDLERDAALNDELSAALVENGRLETALAEAQEREQRVRDLADAYESAPLGDFIADEIRAALDGPQGGAT